MKAIYIVLLCLLASAASYGQTTSYTTADYAHKPVWIEMIKDTSANYFEVQRAYDLYFQHHKKPQGEEEQIGDHAEREKHPSKREQKQLQADNHMRMAIKKYERWHDKMKPYVQDDGSILTPSQRLQIWKAAKNNSNK